MTDWLGTLSEHTSNLAKKAASLIQLEPQRQQQHQHQPEVLDFKAKHTFESRQQESARIRQKYPDRIPVIVLVAPLSGFTIDKSKYLVPYDLSMGQFIYVIRKRIKLRADESMFIFVDQTLVPTSTLMNQLYSQHKADDGFLYLAVHKENSFGNTNQI
jgi:GABA(A) receptor-associated protein